MATLIKSKQIQGVVTASVIEGIFTVSGSLVATDITASGNVTANTFTGNGGGLTNINFGSIVNAPTLVSGSSQIVGILTDLNTFSGSQNTKNATLATYTASVTSQLANLTQATSSFETNGRGIISSSAQISALGYVVGGGGGGTSDYTQLTNVPNGIISGSSQLTSSYDTRYTLSGSVQNVVLPSNLVSGSPQLTSSYDTRYALSGSVLSSFSASVVDRLSALEAEVISTIQYINVGFVSGSYGLNNPSDAPQSGSFYKPLPVLNSNDIEYDSGSGLFKLNAGKTYSLYAYIPHQSYGGQNSVWFQWKDTTNNILIGTPANPVDSTRDVANTIITTTQTTYVGVCQLIANPTSHIHTAHSYILIQEIGVGVSNEIIISGSSDFNTLTNKPTLISSSAQITGLGFVSSSTDISALNTFTSSIDAKFATLGSQTGSFGGGATIPTGTISGSSQLTESFDSRYTLSGSVQNVTLPSNIVSGSSQISYTGLSNIPAGIISSSQQLPQGLVSGSSQVLGGSGVYSGSIPDLSSLNTFTQSIDSRVDNLENATGSYLTSLNGAISSSSQVVLGDVIGFTTYSSSIDSRIDNISVSSTPAGTISSSAQITALGFISESSGDITYNGDRIISNTLLGDLFTNSYNAGTTGSIQDFLNKVFFPNTSPTITSVSYSLNEFSSSGIVGTIQATDSEGQAVTFRTGSTYTDGYFSVVSNGTISVTQKALKSWNTNTDVVVAGAHPIPIVVEDPIGATGSAIIYVRVTPNQAPKFRETSTSGVVITSVSSNLNENSTNGTLVKRVYFTDTENDNLTITSSSIDNNHFVVTKYSTYVDITQNTSSLDYEQQAQYNFSITASDSKYGSGDDLFATASLPIVVNVTDNITPTLSNQTLSSINENSANGATVGTISATDAEGDTKTFLNFELHRLELDNVLVPSGSYNGTSQLTDPHENPFQMNSSGTITRKTGVYINSDLINEYQYRVQVRDNFNANSNVAIITIPITDDTAPSLTTNGTFYIVESAVSGALIRTNSNGFSGTQGDMNSNQTVTWSSSNNRVAINSNGNLSIGQAVSGSYTSGQTFTSTITATNTFGTTNTSTITLNVVANGAPSISYSNVSLNTDTAITGAVISNVTISDQETDVPYRFSLSGTDGGKFNVVPQNANSSSWQIQATGSLEAGTYSVSGSAIDNFGKTTSTGTTFVVATANDYGAVYVYTNNRGASSLNAGNYLGVMAGSYSVSGTTPSEVTSWTIGTPFDKIASNLGDSTIDVSAGVTTYTMYKEAVGSGSYLNTVLAGIGQFNGQPTGQEQVIVIFPSGSDMMGIPTSMTTGFGGSTTGEYVLNLQYDGNGWTNTIESSTVNLITLDSAHLGYTKWYVVGRTTANAANNYQIRITPSSGSAPS